MKISTKTRYGMRFMIDLAQSQGEGRVALKDIADRQGLSKKYLEQVVAPLASAGLLDVTRGNQGGYRLSRDASAITLADIVAASEDGLELLDCMGSLSACERAEDACERMGVEPTGVGRPSSGDRRLSLRAHPRRRRLFRRRCQLVIYHQTSFAYHV